MAFSAGGNGRTTLSEINVTPLVDVMLVLLIIFMVTAPMIKQGAEVDLPKTETVEIDPDEGENILVIDHDGKIMLDGVEIPLDNFEEKIAANAKIQKKKEVILRADKNIKYQMVARVLVKLQKAGVRHLSLDTNPLSKKD